MIELFKRLLQQHQEEEIFIDYLKELRIDINKLGVWHEEATEQINRIKERLDNLEEKNK